MKCKHCHKEILEREFGISDCCSHECRKEFRKIYLAQAQKKCRQIRRQGKNDVQV